MHAEYHIYKQKLYSRNNLVFPAFLMELKYKLNIEKYMRMERNGKQIR